MFSGQRVWLDVETRRRRIFLALLVLGLVGTVAGLAINLMGPGRELVVGATSAIAFMVLGGMAVLFGVRRISNRTLGWAVLAAGSLLTWSTLFRGLYGGPEGQGAAEGILTILQWVPVLLVFAFLAFDGARAIWVAGALVASVALLIGPHAWFGVGAAGGPLTATYAVQFLLANLVTLVALSFFASLQRTLVAWRDTAREMHTLAHTDALTGLANRRAAQEVLGREVARADRYDRDVSVLMLDLDRFKLLNDTYGHPVGDRVLVALAERLRAHHRASDLVARWGGEEFLVVAPETATAQARKLADHLRAQVAKDAFLDGHRVTVSVGVASFRPGDDVEALVARADAAMYRAKEAGRNRVTVVEDLTATDRERL
ncbi:MAG: GGDEF domain-containing protein, partial [Trueperaceae bacterium]|nr:GGDEF domain-containing protein [Trueperaceae bacterium]